MENEGMDLLGRHGGISITKNNVDGFVTLRSPTNFAELDKTIGMFTWLTDHLPWAADISAPLHELSTAKDWEWTATHENAFKRMKHPYTLGSPDCGMYWIWQWFDMTNCPRKRETRSTEKRCIVCRRIEPCTKIFNSSTNSIIPRHVLRWLLQWIRILQIE